MCPSDSSFRAVGSRDSAFLARRRIGLVLALSLTLVAGLAAGAVDAPVAVSPGGDPLGDRMSRVELRCPTFSWGAVDGAAAYELVVYELPDGFERPEVWALAGMDDAQPALQVMVPGSATSWTPSFPDCLEESTKNAWFVRVSDGKLASAWSQPKLFAIDAPREVTPEEAMEVLRQHLGDQGRDPIAPVGMMPDLHGLPAAPDAAQSTVDGALRVQQKATTTAVAAIHAGLGATTGQTVGVRGVTNSEEGGSAGVFGWSTSLTTTGGIGGIGVYGQSDTVAGRGVFGEGSTGVYGLSTSFNGIAVFGHTGGGGSLGSPVGVRGQTAAPDGKGVYGHNFSTTGTAYGVVGQSDSSTGTGVDGTGAVGVSGENNVAGGVGVRGFTNDGTGVSGVADAVSGTITGVYGETTSSEGRGVYARGQSTAVALRAESTSGHHIEAYNSTFSRVFYVDNDGDVFADRSYNCGLGSGCFNTGAGADIAERIDAFEALEAGDVVAVDPERPGTFRRSREPYSSLVVGVVSVQPGITLNNNDLTDNDDGVRTDDRPLLALVGKVPVKASAENGAIRPGDFLTTASTPGHAARCVGAKRCYGRTIGKALEPLAAGTGTVLVWVNLQ